MRSGSVALVSVQSLPLLGARQPTIRTSVLAGSSPGPSLGMIWTFGDGLRRKLGRPGREPVRLQDQRDQIVVGRGRQRAALAVRHVLADEGQQVGHGLLGEALPELVAAERSVAVRAQRVTPGARRAEDGRRAFGLRVGVHAIPHRLARWFGLRRHERVSHRREKQRRGQQEEREADRQARLVECDERACMSARL